MDSLIQEEGITYVFDRVYVDYGAFDSYSERFTSSLDLRTTRLLNL
ncbi:hypothetical protein [Paenibacillus sp. 2TAB26]